MSAFQLTASLVHRGVPRRPAAAWLVVVLAACAMLALAARADALEITDFSVDPLDRSGAVEQQAGARPYVLRTKVHVAGDGTPAGQSGDTKDLIVDLPKGALGDPTGIPTCEPSKLMNLMAPMCREVSQVGFARLQVSQFGAPYMEYPAAIYNVDPQPGEAARFGLAIGGIPIYMSVTVRPDDHGIRITTRDISTAYRVYAMDVQFWGVPSDSGHNADRVCTGGMFPTFNCLSPSNPTPLLSNPTQCDEPQVARMRTRSWQDQDRWIEREHTLPAPVGCENLPFEPSIDMRMTSTAAAGPTGLEVTLDQKYEDSPAGFAAAHMRMTSVTLPEGFSINPASAAGLTACADAALNLGKSDPVSCPESSKIGSVEATSPALDDTLKGGIYVRPQASMDPESGELFRIAMVLESKKRGVSVRLPGSIRANKVTGQLVTTFDNNPQLPVERVTLRFKSGPRAPLAAPQDCGAKTASARVTSWAGQSVNLNSTFQVDCIPGMLGFSPGFTAGSAMPLAGAHSPFSVSILKGDADHALAGVRLEMPPGLLAALKGRLGTQVGIVTAHAGPGTWPYPMPGRVYLEGAYADAPFSLKVVVPAIAGPFNLGEVVVRQRIYVDRKDAHVTVVSDPLPTIVGGVPVRLQRLDVNINAPGFMVNPTSCAPKLIHGLLSSAAGQNAHPTTRFQVGECAALELDPKLEMQFTDKDELKQNKHPGVLANLGAVPGNSNLKKVEVALPLAVALDPNNAKELCPPEGPAAGACPADSIIGHAKATTPLLDVPVEGPVYFVKGTRVTDSGRTVATLPKLYIRLAGQGVLMDLHADSSVTGPVGKQKLVTTFKDLPDVPLNDFTLKINGGENGVLKATEDICGASTTTKIEYTGHTNRVSNRSITAGVEDCGPQITSTSASDTHLSVRVGGIGAGTVTLTGKRIATGSRTIRRASAATVRGRLNLTSSQKRTLSQGRTVKTSVRVRFKPKKGKTVTMRKTVSIEGVKRDDD